MKTRFAAIAVLAVFVVLVSSSVVAFASESDAADVDYSKYYYDQLDDGQKDIYNAYAAITGNPSGSAGSYTYTTTPIAVGDRTEAQIKEDATRAWEASRLDNPYAFWTWTVGNGVPDLTINLSAPNFTVTIKMDDKFATASDMASAAKAAINDFELKGKNEANRVDSINSILTGKSYKYDENGATNVYGIVGDDTHTLSAEGFAAVFKALCDREYEGVKVGCMQVYGTLAHGDTNKVYAWNTVSVEGQIYAVDCATNSDEKEDAWLCAGRYTSYDGEPFSKEHLAFAFNKSSGLGYDFESELLCNGGYDWSDDDDSIVTQIVNNAPWIIIGIICVILAISLVLMARKEA